MKIRIALVVLLLPVFALLACAQDASKRPSPASPGPMQILATARLLSRTTPVRA